MTRPPTREAALSKTLTLPDTVYDALRDSAAREGHDTVEAYLSAFTRRVDAARREVWAERTAALAREVAEACPGPHSDSTDLIREDRAR